MIQLKSKNDLRKIRESCELLTETYREITKYISVGISTKELDTIAYNFITGHNAVPAFLGYQGFSGTLCTSVNEEVIHGIPGKRILQDGDILSLDLGLILDGYYSDSAFTFPLGTISDDKKKLLQVTRECLYRAIEQAVPGNRIKDISRAVESHAHNNGYGIVTDFCGHGTGFELHEDPQIPNYTGRGPNPRLKNGMVLAIEPMINMGTGGIQVLDDGWTVVTNDKKPSAHFEHTVAIVDGKTELFTSFDFAEDFE